MVVHHVLVAPDHVCTRPEYQDKNAEKARINDLSCAPLPRHPSQLSFPAEWAEDAFREALADQDFYLFDRLNFRIIVILIIHIVNAVVTPAPLVLTNQLLLVGRIRIANGSLEI